jgi:hypothetical protein
MRGCLLFSSAAAIGFILWFWMTIIPAINKLPFTGVAAAEYSAPAPTTASARMQNKAVAIMLGDQVFPSQMLPPKRFIVEKNITEARFISRKQMVQDCGKKVIACGHINKAIITLPHPCLYPNDPYALLVCHELGHNNGWNAEHNN